MKRWKAAPCGNGGQVSGTGIVHITRFYKRICEWVPAFAGMTLFIWSMIERSMQVVPLGIAAFDEPHICV
jgi:hypothetical protein